MKVNHYEASRPAAGRNGGQPRLLGPLAAGRRRRHAELCDAAVRGRPRRAHTAAQPPYEHEVFVLEGEGVASRGTSPTSCGGRRGAGQAGRSASVPQHGHVATQIPVPGAELGDGEEGERRSGMRENRIRMRPNGPTCESQPAALGFCRDPSEAPTGGAANVATGGPVGAYDFSTATFPRPIVLGYRRLARWATGLLTPFSPAASMTSPPNALPSFATKSAGTTAATTTRRGPRSATASTTG